MKILVADKLSTVGVEWLKAQDDVEVDVKPGLAPEELAKIVGQYDGMIVRSGVKVNATVLENPGSLRGVARAGVGVDNIDVPLATARGVVVMNTPGGNTLSTAELTMALMMALSRKIALANASLRDGRWDRKAFQGTQLAGKTLGVIGMGRIGKAVAQRAEAMEMRVLGFDPFFAGKVGDSVEMVKDLAELCRRADYITVHVPKSPETVAMIGEAELAVMKPTVRLINAARGGIIDESALLAALQAGKVAGAAIDVYQAEPPESEVERELISHPNVLAVPHLGASTAEAQDQVAIDAAEQLVEFLRGGEVRNAINAPGFDKTLPELIRTYCQLARRIGIVLAGIASGPIRRVCVLYRGPISTMNVAPVGTNVLVGLLGRHMDQPVNVINAPVLAEQRGIEVEQATIDKARRFPHTIEVTVETDRQERSAAGTVLGDRFPRIVAIDSFRMEMKPEGHVLFIFNDDMPGVVGHLGTVLGANGINISDMMISRKKDIAKAMMGIGLDAELSATAIEQIRALEAVNAACHIYLPELPPDESGEANGAP